MTRPSLLLLGSNDLTLAIARWAADAGVPLAGVMSEPAEFRISYSIAPVRNSRYADMAGWCRSRGLTFTEYTTPDDIARTARASGAAAALVAGWYHLVPPHVRALFARGCVGVHASLLPRYRGGAPLSWALLNGDAEAGVSLFQLTDGVDEGPLYDQRRVPIEAEDYVGDLLRKVEVSTLQMLGDTIPVFLSGGLQGRPQQGVPSYSLQRQPSDGTIDWRKPATEIAQLVRSVSRPYPGARAALEGRPLVIWRARVVDAGPVVYGMPGQVARLPDLELPAVVCGAGLLLIEEIEGSDGFDRAALSRCHQRRFDRILP